MRSSERMASSVEPSKSIGSDHESARAGLAMALTLAEVALWEWTPSSDTVVWSDSLRALFDIPEEVPPSVDAWLDRMHPDDCVRVARELSEAVSAGTSIQIEFRALRRDDSIRWFLSRGGPVPTAPGEPARYIGVIVDVTDRHELEEHRAERERQIELARQAARQKALLGAMTAGVVLRDDEGTLIAWNPAIESLVGKAPSSMLRTDPSLDASREDGTPMHAAARPTQVSLNEGRDVRGEVFRVNVNGERRWLSVDVSRLSGPGGGVVTTVFDITKQHDALEELTKSRALLAEVMDASQDGSFRHDFGDDGMVFHSARMREIMGFEAVDQLVPKESFRERMHPEDRVAIEPHYAAIFSGAAERFDLEFRVRHASGEWRWVRSRGKMVAKNADGTPRRLVGAVSDIHRSKTLDLELAASQRRLAMAMEAATIGLFEVDVRTGDAWRNEHHERIFGPAPAGGWSFEAFLARVLPEHRADVRKVLESPTVDGRYAHDLPIASPAGGVAWIATRGRILRDEKGIPTKIMGAVMDITERRLAEDSLQEALRTNEKTLGELREALAHEKILAGLLPICMHCKNIRNDEGYWKQIETYISSKTDVRFSHGLCPDCEARYYSSKS